MFEHSPKILASEEKASTTKLAHNLWEIQAMHIANLHHTDLQVSFSCKKKIYLCPLSLVCFKLLLRFM